MTGYEGGIRTPLVVRWPAVIREGGQKRAAVGHVIDIMPTCLDVAGVEYPSEFEGRKPLPLEGKPLTPICNGQPRKEHEVLCWSVPQHYAIRSGKWNAVKPRRGGAWQLFDMKVDGTETMDLAGENPDLVELLAKRFQEWQNRVGGIE